MHDEQIMCVDVSSNEPGFFGLRQISVGQLLHALDVLGKPVMRSAVEGNKTYKQIITYVVVTAPDEENKPIVLCYERLKGGTDKRLHNNLSIGFGGHVQWQEDSTAGEMLYMNMRKEIEEELYIPNMNSNNFRFLGEMHVDTDDVGQEHLGVVYLYSMESADDMNEVQTREPEKIRLFWAPVDYIHLLKERMESWSQVVMVPLQDGIL